MRQVLVETNWLVDVACPAPFRAPAAIELLDAAGRGQVRLHLPSISISEARKSIRSRYQVGREVDALRRYITSTTRSGGVTQTEADIVRRLLQRYEQAVDADLRDLETTLGQVAASPGVNVFPLNERMHACAVELTLRSGLQLDPFDNAILAAVLTRGEELKVAGETDVVFAEKDSDLQPWTRDGGPKEPLATLYRDARVWVCATFGLDDRAPPADW